MPKRDLNELLTEQDESILEIDVSEKMWGSFLEYAVSVIYARALPNAQDGLKPVQRRILYQMDQMGLRPDKGHVRSQRVAGEVIGKPHPHDNSAIYEALVRLAQLFNLRLPSVDDHGNFDSPDDGLAAARYTEARMAPAVLSLVAGLDEDTVDFVPNYDGQFMQPEALLAAFPQLLVNGTPGIAVRMATNIAPHDLAKTITASIHLIEHPEASVTDLMCFVPGPDFPEGGVIVGLEGIKDAYETGRGAFKTRAKVSIERVTARKVGLIVTELPYMVGPEKIVEKIKGNVNFGHLKGISPVQNLTDQIRGLCLVIEVKNGFNPETVLQQLYARTPLEDFFPVNAVAPVEGQPRTLGLKDMLQVFIDHRISVTTRRCRSRLGKAQDRLHLVEGLLIAVLDIDDVIAIIHSSDDTETARARLMTAFDLPEIQANHILELRLCRLMKFSRIKLEAERDELAGRVAKLEKILSDPSLLKSLVVKGLRAVLARLGTPRCTLLSFSPGTEALPEQGYAALMAALPSVSRSGKGMELQTPDIPRVVVFSCAGGLIRVEGANPLEPGPRTHQDGWLAQLSSTSRSQVTIVTQDDVTHRINVVDLPAIPRFDTGLSLAAVTPASMLVHSDSPAIGLLDPGLETVCAMGTAHGTVKRLKPDAPARDEWEVITLEDGDRLVGFAPSTDSSDLVFISSDAQLLRVPADKVRPQGRTASGMVGMKLLDAAEAIGFWVVDSAEDSLTVTVAAVEGALLGSGQTTAKVAPFALYPSKGRGGQGVRTQRFLRGEDRLDLAWVGPRPARVANVKGSPVDLSVEGERRDASGMPIVVSIDSLG